jgi:hypothetical protein
VTRRAVVVEVGGKRVLFTPHVAPPPPSFRRRRVFAGYQ